MKKLLKYIILASALAITGCATSHVTVGNDFNQLQVQKIVKGTTTKQQLVTLFGQPYSKAVIGANSEKWLYQYTNVKSDAQSLIFTAKVQTQGMQKVLDILLENDVVTNFTYSERPLGNQININVN